MREGWQGEDYLIPFDESEIAHITSRHDIASYVANQQVVGLKGWDDFIVRNAAGQLSIIPTVPLDTQYLAPTTVALGGDGLVPDARVTGKIKWYTKPLVFGGESASPNNMCWITLDQHIEAVKWWNQMYRTVARK